MNNPFVSVIIPNYNHAQFLDERINSVLRQAYKNFEIIILDDNSTDNSLEVIKKYKDNPHISQIVVNSENSGSPFLQWHKGFRLAKGELIWIAESDDCCSATFLSRLIECFIAYKDLSYAFCRSVYMDEKGQIGHVCQPFFSKDFLMDGETFINKYMIWGNKVFNASSVLFKKSVAMTINSDYTTYRGAGDWLFWIMMAEKGRIAVIADSLNFYRYYSANTTSKARLTGNQDFENKMIYDYFDRNGYLTFLNSIRLRKKYICEIKYRNRYKNEEIREKSLKIWGNNIFIHLLAWVSHKIQYK